MHLVTILLLLLFPLLMMGCVVLCYFNPIGAQVLLSPERLQPVEHIPAVVDLLGFILVRDPNMRPTAGAVAQR